MGYRIQTAISSRSSARRSALSADRCGLRAVGDGVACKQFLDEDPE